MTARCTDCNAYLFFDERKQPYSPYLRCECGGEMDIMTGSGKLFGAHPYYPGKTSIDENGQQCFYAYKNAHSQFFVYYEGKMMKIQTQLK